MKTLASLLLLVGAFSMTTGCTPAYTAQERGALILRTWDYEGRQMNDDIDDALLLRPPSRLTVWNVR